jgi:hypothetical protein
MKMNNVGTDNKMSTLKLSGIKISADDEEDLGLLLMMSEVDFRDTITREEVMQKLKT